MHSIKRWGSDIAYAASCRNQRQFTTFLLLHTMMTLGWCFGSASVEEYRQTLMRRCGRRRPTGGSQTTAARIRCHTSRSTSSCSLSSRNCQRRTFEEWVVSVNKRVLWYQQEYCCVGNNQPTTAALCRLCRCCPRFQRRCCFPPSLPLPPTAAGVKCHILPTIALP